MTGSLGTAAGLGAASGLRTMQGLAWVSRALASAMDQRVLHAAQALPELLEEVIRANLTPMHFLDRVLQQELERKNERRVATTLKLSGTSGLAHPPSQGVVFSPPFPGCERSGC